MSLYQILAHQALSIVNYFFQAPLPDPAQVFPWIYSGANNQASSSHHHNSHFPNSKLAAPQQLKSFVLFVRSAPIQDTSVPIIEDSALLKNSVDYFALLSPYDEMDVEESESKHINLRNFITNYLLYLDIITSEKDPYINTIMDDVLKVGRLPIFKDISNESFSIRSFNMQTNIISTISDFIVYCFNKDHLLDFDFSNHMQKSKATTCKCLCVSRLLNLAQIHFQKNNPEILHTESVQISATANPSGKLKPVEIQEDHCGEGLQESDDESEINFNSVLCALKKNEGFAVVHDDTEEVFENVIPHFKACKENFDQSKHSLFFSDEATVVTNPTKHFLQLPKLHCMTSSCNSMNSFYNTFIIERPMEILLNDEYFSSLISVPPYTNTGDELNINSLITNHLAEQRALPNGTTSNLLLLNLFEINSINNWEINYLIKEKLEIWKISSAQQFQPGLWIGNEGDYYMWKQLNENNKSAPDSINHYEPEETFENKVPKYCSIYNSLFLSDNPLVESHCNNRKLLNEPPVNWKFLIEVHATSKLPTLMKLYEIFSFIKACEKPKKHHMQIPYDTCITLQFPASGTIAGLGNLSVQDILIIINVCKVIYYKNHLVFPTLMFCPEGYTETALLAIIYLMYSTGTSLRDAIIDFYIKYGRPFYLFDNDYKLLLDLEAIILHYSPKNNMSVNDNELEELNDDNSNIISEILIKSFSQKRQSSNPEFVNPITNNDWFNELIANNSGSLVPSRILPNLFLGSLNHANSLPLLAKFKINTIVSVGETLPWFSFLPPEAYSINNTFGKSGTCHVIKFLKESPAALAKAPYLENFPIDQILLVNDIKDDGIDSISNDLLNDIFDFFTQYTQTDVNSITNFDLPQKTLVHCKVGVSRSATVVIAYLMRFLGMTLEKAYLFVRVRRLNIIIQPNLRLFYGLFKIQEELLVKFHSQEDANKSSKRRFFNSHTTDGPYQFSIPRRKKSSVSSSSMDNSSLYSDEYYYTPGISAGSYISNGSGKQPIRFIRNREASNASSLQTSITIDSNNSEDEQDFEEDDDSVVVDSSDDNYEPPEPFSKPKTISTISADPAHKSNGSSKLTKSFDQFTKLNGEHAKTQLVNSKWLRNVDWVIFCQRVHELNKF